MTKIKMLKGFLESIDTLSESQVHGILEASALLFECNLIEGGIADGMSPQDVANTHGVPLEDIEAQLDMGIDVEMEHTNDEKVAREIALDHLAELPDYYTRLAKMEDKGEEDRDEAKEEEQVKLGEEMEEREREHHAKMEAEETPATKETPALDKLIAALAKKVQEEGNKELATLLAAASKEKKTLTESEGELWAKEAHPDEGKMHRLLDIPKGKKITEMYTSGKQLAKDLLKANKGDKRKTGGQLGFVANVNKGTSVFDAALKALADLDGNKD